MKYAILADLHLSDTRGTSQELILDWAIETAKSHSVSALVGAGDLTNRGSFPASQTLYKKLNDSGLPFYLSPGNAELRSAEDLERSAELLRTAQEAEGLILLDSSRMKLSEESRALLAKSTQKGLIAVTHCPPETLPEEDQKFINKAINNGKIRKVYAGHKHFDSNCETLRLLRGLDPDKSSGGAPALLIVDTESKEELELVYKYADAAKWSREEKDKFMKNLGIAGMWIPAETFLFAAENNIELIELRFVEEPDYLEELKLWREKVPAGKLSLHLPEYHPDEKNEDRLKFAVQQAISLGCYRVTFHTPKVDPVKMLDKKFRQELKNKTVELLKPLTDAGIIIGIENLHTYPDRPITFGCTIEECKNWVIDLAEELPGLGFHLDVGHARNNKPYSISENISDYYAVLGNKMNAIHLHQVRGEADGTMTNHHPINEIFGKLIPLASLFCAWKTKQIPENIAIIIEVRGEGQSSWELIRKYLD